MKKIMVVLLMVPVLMVPNLAVAAEQLPDSAPPGSDAPQTREKGPADPMDGSELEAMYLESPRELDTSDESRGLNAVSPDTRYLEGEQRELLQRQNDSLRPPTLRDDAPPPPPPTLIPIREL